MVQHYAKNEGLVWEGVLVGVVTNLMFFFSKTRGKGGNCNIYLCSIVTKEEYFIWHCLLQFCLFVV